jgi:hypothetical protein
MQEETTGKLRLEGFEETEITWSRVDDGFICTPTIAVSSSGPWGVYGDVTDERGQVIEEGTTFGCGVRSELEAGSFYFSRIHGEPCVVQIDTAVGSVYRQIPALDADLDLGTLVIDDTRGGLGVFLYQATMLYDSQLELETYRVESVLSPSPASEAGIQAKDDIVKVNGMPVASTHPAQLLQLPVGSPVELELSDGRLLSLTTAPLPQLLDSIGQQDPQRAAEMARTRAAGALY